MLPTRDPLQNKRPKHTESEGLETNIPRKWMGKNKPGYQYLISDKVDFKRRDIKRDPEGHFIILMGRTYQEDIRIINMYPT